MGKNKRVFIIAEAGVNHNGDLGLAKRLVDAAARAGADAVKFQTFRAGDLAAANAPKAPYQKRRSGGASQLSMLKRLELDEKSHKALVAHCKKAGVVFMSSAFDPGSIALLGRLGVKIIKIPSGEVTNLPYLKKVAGLKRRIFLSTGMADMKEVRRAIDVLTRSGTPRSGIVVMQCTTDYPAAFADANLRAMDTMKAMLGTAVGYSDHTPGIEAAVAAAALGASVIEKHFTLDKSMPGPDHRASLEPEEFAAMVRAIRNVEQALGDGIKRPMQSELRNRKAVRKSIVAARPIRKGEVFDATNITVKRPAGGIDPMRWDTIVGKAAAKDFRADEMIRLQW